METKKLIEKIKQKAKKVEKNCSVRLHDVYLDSIFQRASSLKKEIPKKYLHLYTINNIEKVAKSYRGSAEYTEIMIGFRKSGKMYLVSMNRSSCSSTSYGDRYTKIRVNNDYLQKYLGNIDFKYKLLIRRSLMNYDKQTMREVVEGKYN